MNPMEKLYAFGDMLSGWRWDMSLEVGGGFIGLHDVELDFNIYSTHVDDYETIYAKALAANAKIQADMQKFLEFRKEIADNHEFYQEFQEQRDFDKVLESCNNLEKWLNED